MRGVDSGSPPSRGRADPAIWDPAICDPVISKPVACDPVACDLINRIAQRAQGIQQWHDSEPGDPLIDWRLRLTAAHVAGPPLRLAALLAADDPTFIHDVFGIRRHADPDTRLPDGRFRPRLVVTRPAGPGMSPKP